MGNPWTQSWVERCSLRCWCLGARRDWLVLGKWELARALYLRNFTWGWRFLAYYALRAIRNIFRTAFSDDNCGENPCAVDCVGRKSVFSSQKLKFLKR
jgi:hypothetical protein